MKTILATVSAIALAAIVNVAPASAVQYGTPSAGTPHYEWQYHYTGHHPVYRGGWVLVK